MLSGPTPRKPAPKAKPVNLGSLLADAVAPAVKAVQVIDKEQQRPHPKTSTPLVHPNERRDLPQPSPKSIQRAQRPTLADLARQHAGGSGHVGTKSHGGGGLASINLAGLAEDALTLPQAAGKALHVPAPVLAGLGGPLGVARAVAPKLLHNSFKDAVEIPAEAIPSTYHALSPLGHGDIKTTIKRLSDPYVQLAEHPGRQLTEHPLGSFLMLEGIRGGLSKGAGRALRSGVAGKSAKAYASTTREAATLPKSTFTERRDYSPDLMRNRAQKAIERKKIAKADELRARATRIEGHVLEHGSTGVNSLDLVKELRTEANHIDPRMSTDRQIKRRDNEGESAYEGIRRADLQGQLRKLTPEMGRKAPAIMRPIVEGVIKATPEDLAKHIEELKAVRQDLADRIRSGDAPSKDKLKIRAADETIRRYSADLKAVRAGKIDMKALLAHGEDFAAHRNHLDALLSDLEVHAPDQVERRRLLPAAVRNLGLRHEEGTGFVDESGRVMPTTEIRAALAHPDRITEPAYLSQSPTSRGARNFYRSSSQAANDGNKTYTGQATLQGTYDTHPEIFRETIARAQTLVSQQSHWQQRIAENAIRNGATGNILTRASHAEIDRHIKTLEANGYPVKLTAVQINPFAGSKAQLEKLLEDSSVHPDSVNQSAHADLVSALENAKAGNGKGEGRWAIVPKSFVDNQLQHAKNLNPNDFGKAYGKLTSLSRKVVLLTPHFVATNGIEAAFKGALNGALPGITRSYWHMKAVLDHLEVMDPKAHAHLMERGIGVGRGGFVQRGHIHRPIEGDSAGARAAGAVRASAPGHLVVNTWDRVTHTVFDTVNASIEREFKIAQAGKYLKHSGLLSKEGIKLSHDAIEQAAKGLTNTHEQAALGRYVDKAFGKYRAFNPAQRKWIQTYTQFAAWMINSVNFIYRVLPADHPVITALTASASQASSEWRKQHGLTEFNAPGVSRVPGFLQGTVPGANGSHLRGFTQATPFGALSDPGGTAGSSILPLMQGLISAAKGQDFTGRQLRDKNGQPVDVGGELKAGLGELAGLTIPGYGMFKTQKKAGGSVAHRARRLVDPFMFTQGKPGAVSSTPSKGGGARSRPTPSAPVSQDPVQRVWDRINAAQSKTSSSSAVDKVWERIAAAQQGQ